MCPGSDLVGQREAERLAFIFQKKKKQLPIWIEGQSERAGVKPCPALTLHTPLCYGDDAAVMVTDLAAEWSRSVALRSRAWPGSSGPLGHEERKQPRTPSPSPPRGEAMPAETFNPFIGLRA